MKATPTHGWRTLQTDSPPKRAAIHPKIGDQIGIPENAPATGKKVAIVGASGYLWLRSSLPQTTGSVAVPRLGAKVEILRDGDGVATGDFDLASLERVAIRRVVKQAGCAAATGHFAGDHVRAVAAEH